MIERPREQYGVGARSSRVVIHSLPAEVYDVVDRKPRRFANKTELETLIANRAP